MHYLITGHTGFKGSWLSLLLAVRGDTVSGIALDPPPGGLFEASGLTADLADDVRLDIRDATGTADAIRAISPDVVIHLAAQPLVRESYLDPRTTFETNALGTLNVLEGVSTTSSVRAHVVITTDKVYRNINQEAGYVESDALGGFDPYSASKAMADILTQSWVASFPGVPTAIARGGNVIGGGDVSKDRLLPDLLRSFADGVPAVIRRPSAVRPWQHVLDCLRGYLVIADALLDGAGQGAWNIGPGRESFVPVSTLADDASRLWSGGARWASEGEETGPHEAALLALDAAKAERELGWRNLLPYPASVEWTVDWNKAVGSGRSARDVTIEQIERFQALP